MTAMYFKIPVNFYEKFEIRKLNLENVDEVSTFIKEYYTTRSPIGAIFGERLEDTQALDVMRLNEKLKGSKGFGCYEKDKEEIIGVAFGTIHKPDPSSPCPIGEYLNDLPSIPLVEQFVQEFESDLHERLNVRKIMLGEMLTVHPDYTGSGISDVFLDKIFGEAIQAECESYVCLALSFYMQRKLEKLGFSLLKEAKYSDWVDPKTGSKPDLHLSPIHSHIKMYHTSVPPHACKSEFQQRCLDS